uniref:Uncharacterized protein n=1 Tax=Megaselia scalaris TaxID=36166 RepID=T1GYM4_MEGSC
MTVIKQYLVLHPKQTSYDSHQRIIGTSAPKDRSLTKSCTYIPKNLPVTVIKDYICQIVDLEERSSRQVSESEKTIFSPCIVTSQANVLEMLENFSKCLRKGLRKYAPASLIFFVTERDIHKENGQYPQQ